MRKVALLVVHELTLLMKDRQALGLLFVMPLVFIVFLTLALQDVYLAKVGKKVSLEFVAGEQCVSSSSICSKLLLELQRLQYDIQVTKTATLKRQLALILPENIENTIELVKKDKPLSDQDRVQLIFDPTMDQAVRALVKPIFFWRCSP